MQATWDGQWHNHAEPYWGPRVMLTGKHIPVYFCASKHITPLVVDPQPELGHLMAQLSLLPLSCHGSTLGSAPRDSGSRGLHAQNYPQMYTNGQICTFPIIKE